jgi:hypothetical protein
MTVGTREVDPRKHDQDIGPAWVPDVLIGREKMDMAHFASLLTADSILREAEQPLPVLHLQAHRLDQLKFPHTWIGFGKTKPGEGLEPTEKTEYHCSGRTKIAGFKVPTSESSRGSVTYYPNEHSAFQADTTEGWWQRSHVKGVEQYGGSNNLLYSHDYGDEISFGRDFISSWLLNIINAPEFNSPVILTDRNYNLASHPWERWRRAEEEEYRFIAVGSEAVQAFFDKNFFDLQERARQPSPLRSMLEAVADSLDIKPE